MVQPNRNFNYRDTRKVIFMLWEKYVFEAFDLVAYQCGRGIDSAHQAFLTYAGYYYAILNYDNPEALLSASWYVETPYLWS